MPTPVTTSAMPAPRDFSFAPTEDLSDLGGPARRFEQNVAAIKLLKQIEAEARAPGDLMPDEQQTLARYTGWGDTEVFKRAFPHGAYSCSTPCAELHGLLTTEELDQLRASTLNAHYTALPIIRAIYMGLEHLGLGNLSALRVLEPAAGVGHFFGAMPAHLAAKSERVAVEIDSLTVRILERLYPETKVFKQGFETAPLPHDYFDLAISNVPFGDYPVHDPQIKQKYLRASIHDYFFAKALELIRPSGIIAFITSRYSLDKRESRIRRYLAERAELLAATRLPEGAFKKNAGTEVVADVIILRKREAPIKLSPPEPAWIDLAPLQLQHPQGEVEEVPINGLFAAQPHLMLGTPTLARGMYRRSEFSVEPDGRNAQAALGDSLVAQLPSQAMTQAAQLSLTAIEISVQAAGTTSVKDEAAEAFDLERLRGLDQMRATSLLELYTLAKKIISLQLIDAPDDILDVVLKSLNEQYDRFRARFGCINSPENTRHVNKRSPVLPFLKALEEPVGKNSFRKTPFFTGRTIRPNKEVTHAATPKDVLLHCLNERGRVEIERIAALVGQSEQAVITSLKGIIYETPSGCFETADEYLSGDVRSKLREAEAAAALNPRFEETVTALRDALPPLVEPGQIGARLGSGWIPTEVVEQFMRELIPDYQGKVKYIEALGTWTVESPGHYAANSIEATQVWGTSERHAIQLIEDALNLHNPVVYDQIEINGQKKSVVNETETIAAQAKQAEIKLKFAAWLWEDHDRATRLAEIYNERYNCLRERRYDGSHLTLPGASTAIEPRPHQKDAVWRIVQSRTTLLGHCVGAGKTISMVAGARELKRLGVTHKVMAAVPNHLPTQWADEARRLYPDIKLLVPTKEELSREQRGELMSRVATGDWDLIIVPHTSFKMLPLQPETVREFIGREIAVLREYLEELGSNRDKLTRTTCKRIEAAIKKLETHLKDKESEISRDARATITWEELGVDALFVDEAAAYKNLHCPTKMSRIAGLPNSDSQRAFDLFMKVRTILDQGGRVVFATATPISNTIAEVFVMMKFLQLETLEQMGLAHFDAWAQAFAETSQGLEMKPDGSGFRVNTRFNRFTNLPELATLWRQVLDVRTAEQLNLPRPRVAGGGPIAVTIPASPELKQFTKSLAERVTRIKNRGVKPEDDNMLKITSEGRKAALDIRLVRPELPEPADSKVNALVARIKEIYDRYHAQRAAQLVFSDIHCMKAK